MPGERRKFRPEVRVEGALTHHGNAGQFVYNWERSSLFNDGASPISELREPL